MEAKLCGHLKTKKELSMPSQEFELRLSISQLRPAAALWYLQINYIC